MPDFRDFFNEASDSHQSSQSHRSSKESATELINIKKEIEKDNSIDIEADIMMGYAKRNFNAAKRQGFDDDKAFELTQMVFFGMLQRGYI